MSKFFEELSRCLREGGIESSNIEDKRLEVFLHGQPVLFVSPGHDVFLLPAGSRNEEASDLYHRVAGMADEVYEYVEAVQNAPLLRASSLKDEFHLLADFGGAVLAGIELPKEWGYQFTHGSGITTGQPSSMAITIWEISKAQSRTSPSVPG